MTALVLSHFLALGMTDDPPFGAIYRLFCARPRLAPTYSDDHLINQTQSPRVCVRIRNTSMGSALTFPPTPQLSAHRPHYLPRDL